MRPKEFQHNCLILWSYQVPEIKQLYFVRHKITKRGQNNLGFIHMGISSSQNGNKGNNKLTNFHNLAKTAIAPLLTLEDATYNILSSSYCLLSLILS